MIPPRGQLEHLVACSTRAGDPKARRAAALLRDRARYAGVAIGALLDIFDPEIVVHRRRPPGSADGIARIAQGGGGTGDATQRRQ